MNIRIKTFLKKAKLLAPLVIFYRNYRTNKNFKKEKFRDEILESILKNVKSREIILILNEFLGEFKIGIDSDLLKRYLQFGEYENDIIKVIKDNIEPSLDFIDVGANIGLFTVFASKIINDDSKVLAIEPTPNAFKRLKDNINRNSIQKKVFLFDGVVSDKIGELELETIDGMEEYSSLGKIVQVSSDTFKKSIIKVASETIDNLVEINNIKPGFIKIDTEGAEFRVLTGAIETIKKFNPIILSELCDDYLITMGNNSKQVVTLLETLNYRVTNLKDGTNKIEYPFRGNILAIPNN
jgi:FkbM family methyltransferase